MSDSHYFHDAGGAMKADHPTYIERKADGDLFNALNNGELCYVLNARQMGKSSLRTRMMERLKGTGSICTLIDLGDLNDIGNSNTDDRGQMKWYLSLLSELVEKFDILDSTAEKQWIAQNIHRPPNILLMKFFDEILLKNLHQDRIVIFLDEIDALISKRFKYDFLAFIRSCYNRRSDYPDFNRIVFCLLGVVAPSDLMADAQHTFNIGRDIELTGLEYSKASASFAQGLIGKVNHPQATIKQIFNWTNGQPFLTQKLCQLVADCAENNLIDVDRFVEVDLIDNWSSRSDLIKQHLQYISNNLLTRDRGSDPVSLLITLGQILDNKQIEYNPKDLEHTQLKLSGIILVEPEGIKIFNKLYARIFNKDWIELQLDNPQKIWFPQEDLEEITYLAPPSKFIQNIAKAIDTKIVAIVGFLLFIDLLSLYTSYNLFSSAAWTKAFNPSGNSLIVELFRSTFLILFSAYAFKYLFYKETQKILTLDRLWWMRTCLGVLIFLFTIFVSIYNLYLGPVNLANKQPLALTENLSWVRNYSVPYLFYFPYAIINFVFISIPVISTTIYSSVISISNNIKIIKIFNESIEKINNYVDYLGADNLSNEEKENIIKQMMDYFLKLSTTFLEDFTRYSIFFVGIVFLFSFELTIGKITLAETGLAMTLIDYSFCWISIIIIFFCGAIEYQKIFTEACNLLLKIGDIENKFNEFKLKHNLTKLIGTGIWKIKTQAYFFPCLSVIVFGIVLMFAIR